MSDDDLFPSIDTAEPDTAPPPPPPPPANATVTADEQPDFGTMGDTNADEQANSGPPSTATPKASKSKAAKPPKTAKTEIAPAEMAALINRIVRKLDAVRSADPDTLAALAAALGVRPDDAAGIVSACLTGSPKIKAMADTIELHEADPLSLGIELLTRGRERMLAIWRILCSLELADGTMHASDAKAALAIAQIITTGATAEHIDMLRSGIKLARR